MPIEEAPHNVFISWSGKRSAALAAALYEWLPSVVQAASVWMSSENIQTGQRWRTALNQQLQTIRIGILCLTPENQDRPWIVFEAGVLSRVVDEKARVIPYLLHLTKIDTGPLADFQGTSADPEDAESTWRLVKSINAAMSSRVSEAVLRKCFDRSWPDLASKLREIPPKSPKGEEVSDVPAKPEDKIDEILDRLRLMGRDVELSRELLVTGTSFAAPSAATIDRAALEAMYGADLQADPSETLAATYLAKYGRPVVQRKKKKNPFRRGS